MLVGLIVALVLIYSLAFWVLPRSERVTAPPRSTPASNPTPGLSAAIPTVPLAAPVATPTLTTTPTLLPSPTATATRTSSATPTPTATATLTPTATVALASQFARKPIALMVENHPDARPQSGLNRADVVYEVVTEGFITRFLAIFANHDAEVVGPIRSARHYFVALAAEYNAILGHAGASPQGFQAIERTGLVTVDNNFGEGKFYRIRDRVAPHNLYTSVGGVRSSASDRGSATLSGIEYKPDAPLRPANVEAIRVTYPDGYYVQYRYDSASNSYLRFMLGQPHVDAYDGAQYRPRNVVVQFVRIWPIPGDDAGRVDMELTGSGPAYVFQDGRVVKGTWVKRSETGPTRFRDAEGQPVRLNAGPTWIQIVHTTGSIRYE
ncbi:MAG: DUF3048 domain-containing protein [Chloroflexi bacterium]|nr:DUF3048 domain-containing protein [Chloroflexota bacterium]